MPLVLSVLVDVFPRKAAKEDAVETGMESVQVGTTHVTDARLGLGRERANKGYLVRESFTAGDNAHLRWTMAKQTETDSLPAQVDFYLPFTQMFQGAKGLKRPEARTA